MKRCLLLAVLLPLFAFAAPGGGAPFKIKGLVADTTGTAVGYATVAAYRDTTLLDAVAADASGRFETGVSEKGNYLLRVSAVGYGESECPVSVSKDRTDAGIITLREGVGIDDVVVSMRRPLIVADAEKMTYSVEDDPQATTGTLDEIIRKIPQLSLDADGNVLLNGQSNFRILLNGHQASSLSRNFKDIIKSMPASQIKRIEVITNPSMKYDAEGAGGIINIITQKKESFDGYNGSVQAGMGVQSGQYYYGSANVTVQTGKFAVGASGYYNYQTDQSGEILNTSSQENFGAERVKYMDSENRYKFRGKNYGFTLDLSYQPDTLNLITFSGSLWLGRFRNNMTGFLTASDADRQPLYGYDQTYDNRFNYTGGTLALNYEHTFNREEHTLTLSDEFGLDPDNYWTEREMVWYNGLGAERTGQYEPTQSIENTFQADYQNPLTEHHRVEAGMKHIFRSNRIDDTYTDVPLGSETATERLAHLQYSQHIFSIYAGYGVTYTKWNGRAGARFEQTWNNASGFDRNPYAFRNRMSNLIPYASLTFLPKEGHTLSFTYTQRIQRPGIYELSSAVDDTDPLFVSYGNPDLRAAVFNSLTLQYNYFSKKWSATFALKSFLSNNYMTNYSFVDAQGVTNTTYGNGVKARTYGFNGSLSYRPSEKFSLSFSYNGGYGTYDYAEQGIHTSLFSYGQNLNMDIALWKSARLMLGESYYSGEADLGYESKGSYYYYIGLKQKFLKEKLELSVTTNCPFNQYREYRTVSETPTYVRYSARRNIARSFRFSVTYRFGKQGVGVKSASRTIENDDQSSGGSSKGGGR